jgi:hypothetical protein
MKDEEIKNKNLPVVQKNDFFHRFRKKMQKYIFMGMTALGIVIPYAQQTADIVNAEPPPSPPPVNEVMKENMEARYEQAFQDIGIKVELHEDMEIPDDPPQEEYDKEYKGEEPKIEFKIGDGEDSNTEFYKKLKGNVEDDVALYRKYKEKLTKNKDNKTKETLKTNTKENNDKQEDR